MPVSAGGVESTVTVCVSVVTLPAASEMTACSSYPPDGSAVVSHAPTNGDAASLEMPVKAPPPVGR